MNIHRLKEAEAAFIARFPEGFDDPGLARIRKSHNVERLAAFARSELTEVTFALPERFVDTLLKIISRSSMVSRFEKPPFRELLSALSPAEKRHLAEAYRKRLDRRTQREGFEEIVDLFAHYKLARWSLVSAAPFYFAPSKEAFVKPSTAKRIVRFLDVEGLHYHPKPDWAFYTGYRKLILDIKEHVDSTLTPNNAAITGFLMSSM